MNDICFLILDKAFSVFFRVIDDQYRIEYYCGAFLWLTSLIHVVYLRKKASKGLDITSVDLQRCAWKLILCVCILHLVYSIDLLFESEIKMRTYIQVLLLCLAIGIRIVAIIMDKRKIKAVKVTQKGACVICLLTGIILSSWIAALVEKEWIGYTTIGYFNESLNCYVEVLGIILLFFCINIFNKYGKFLIRQPERKKYIVTFSVSGFASMLAFVGVIASTLDVHSILIIDGKDWYEDYYVLSEEEKEYFGKELYVEINETCNLKEQYIGAKMVHHADHILELYGEEQEETELLSCKIKGDTGHVWVCYSIFWGNEEEDDERYRVIQQIALWEIKKTPDREWKVTEMRECTDNDYDNDYDDYYEDYDEYGDEDDCDED